MKTGDKVTANEELLTISTRFKIGHEFTITAIGKYFCDVRDDNGKSLKSVSVRAFSPLTTQSTKQ